MVEEFVFAKLADGAARRSRSGTTTGLLHAIFAHAVKRGWCASNPVTLVEQPPTHRRTQTSASSPSTRSRRSSKRLRNDERGRTERVLYLTAAMTGMRRGELVALRWQDVDCAARQIRVRRNFVRSEFGTPKSRRSSRAVPLAPRLATALAEHHQLSRFKGDLDLVFAHPSTGRVLDPHKLRRRFQAAVNQAGVRRVRFHDLRHTFGTQMASAGAPLRAIQEWLGHADLRTTLIYADFALDPNEGARYAERAFGRQSGHVRQRAGRGDFWACRPNRTSASLPFELGEARSFAGLTIVPLFPPRRHWPTTSASTRPPPPG